MQTTTTRRSFVYGSLLAGLAAAAGLSSLRTPALAADKKDEAEVEYVDIVDYAGRTVTIPTVVNRVYCAVPTGEAMVATLAPTKLIGWVNAPTEATMEYLPQELAEMPVIGGWMGQKVTANIEDIIKAAPEVIIYMSALAKTLESDEQPDKIQTQTGIPVVAVPADLEMTGDVYRTLGAWIGEGERGKLLGDFYDEHLKEFEELLATVEEEDIPTVYYAEEADGLCTEPEGSQHTQVISFCRAINVAADVEMGAGQGLTPVSIEEVIGWNPEMILCHSGYLLAEDILDNPQWADIQAIQNGRVYNTPAVPFNWFDRPPNVMRLLGIVWFANICYPQLEIDVEGFVTEFFELFYNVELTEEQLEALVNQAEISFKESKGK